MRSAAIVAVAWWAVACGHGPASSTADGAIDTPADSAFATIQIVVTTDQGTGAAGVPVAAAAVLIERADGTFDRATTDATGTAYVAPAGPTTSVHVLYELEAGSWRAYTIAAAPPGAIVRLGGRGVTTTASMTFALPAGAAGDSYVIHGPRSCSLTATPASTPAFVVNYDPRCEGRTAHLIAEKVNDAFQTSTLDLGDVMFATGTMVSPATAYTANTATLVTFTNLPTGTQAFVEDGAELDGDDLTIVNYYPSYHPGAMGGLGLYEPASANANDVKAQLDVGTSGVTVSELVVPVAYTPTVTVDVSMMLPLFPTLAVGSDDRSLAWTGGGGATLLVADATIGSSAAIHWTAYLDPSATGVVFPALPADLAAADPGSNGVWVNLSVQAVQLPGESVTDLLGTFDAQGTSYPTNGTTVPADGYAISSVVMATTP